MSEENLKHIKKTARYTRGEETIQDEDWGIYSNN